MLYKVSNNKNMLVAGWLENCLQGHLNIISEHTEFYFRLWNAYYEKTLQKYFMLD